MNTQQIDEKALFNAARRITNPAAQVEYLTQACGDDPTVIQRIRDLLRAHEEEQSFLESPPSEYAAMGDQSSLSERPGTVIGPYKLLQQIGEGGMGVVFMAEQTEPVQRTVALKIIKPGMDTRQVIARFEAERQALAMMDHPNIAKVLDAGTTETGRPYFVMELVKGVPITKYCDEQHLHDSRAAGAVRAGLPGGAARPSERHHPSRPQAVERAGGRVRRPGRAQGHRLRRGQGDGADD